MGLLFSGSGGLLCLCRSLLAVDHSFGVDLVWNMLLMKSQTMRSSWCAISNLGGSSLKAWRVKSPNRSSNSTYLACLGQEPHCLPVEEPSDPPRRTSNGGFSSGLLHFLWACFGGYRRALPSSRVLSCPGSGWFVHGDAKTPCSRSP